MKSVRLLPIVIAATAALLLLKGIGLVTSGGYVLTGTSLAMAEGAAHGGGGGGEAGGAANPTMQLPLDATMTDSSPTMDDTSETLPLGQEDASAGGHGGAAEGEAAPADGAEASPGEHGDAAPAEHGEAVVEPLSVGNVVCPPTGEAAADAGHGAVAESEAAPAGENLDGFAKLATPPVDCTPDPGVNADGDALPLIKNGAGQLVPLAEVSENASSENALLARLGERRDALDQRETELEMRAALVEAAEKRLEERTAALQALEAKINALVEEKKTAEKQQFIGIVAMYETMKPKEAAAIFDQMDINVLLQIARAMNPRKMAPILAKMDTVKAKNLTAGLAVDEAQAEADLTAEDLASLPQIVGQ